MKTDVYFAKLGVIDKTNTICIATVQPTTDFPKYDKGPNCLTI